MRYLLSLVMTKTQVTEISNTHTDWPFTSVKQWIHNTKAFIKLDCPNCNTEYKRQIAEADNLHAMVYAYGIDTRGKK